MNTFRKILAAALLVCLVLCSACAVADTELTAESETKSASASVVLDLGEQPTSYTVIIPSQIDLDPTTGKGSATVTLKSGFVLTDITKLEVFLSGGYSSGESATGINIGDIFPAEMTLRNTKNSSTISCRITSTASDYISTKKPLISVTNQSDNTNDRAFKLDFSATTSLPYGKYTGTLTFSIKTSK